jgi:hypothetical protein
MIDCRSFAPLDLGHLNGAKKTKMSPPVILSIVLLCIAIVVILAYVVRLGMGSRSPAGAPASTPIEEPEYAAVGMSTVEPMPMPTAVAVGAAVVADPNLDAEPSLYFPDETGAPYIEAQGAAAGLQPASTDSQLGDVGYFGNLVPESHRMEVSDTASLNLGAVMPSSWRAGAEDDDIKPESESHPLDNYFTPFGSLSDHGLEQEHPQWAKLRLSREATKRAIENSPDVTRQIVLRQANKVGLDETFALRPAPKAPLFTAGVHVFQDSQSRQETVAQAMQGVYPRESLGIA